MIQLICGWMHVELVTPRISPHGHPRARGPHPQSLRRLTSTSSNPSMPQRFAPTKVTPSSPQASKASEVVSHNLNTRRPKHPAPLLLHGRRHRMPTTKPSPQPAYPPRLLRTLAPRFTCLPPPVRRGLQIRVANLRVSAGLCASAPSLHPLRKSNFSTPALQWMGVLLYENVRIQSHVLKQTVTTPPAPPSRLPPQIGTYMVFRERLLAAYGSL